MYPEFEEKILKHCQKPGQYLGGELNSIRKDPDSVKLRWGLLFPDLYELGIANLGISVLYTILNKYPDVSAERFYMPAKDAVTLMERENIPPLSLENKLPAGQFDILGITLPYELTVTNILKFLTLSSIDIHRDKRDFPVIIGGGSMAFNPLPLAGFIDAFVVGDGEEVLQEINEAYFSCGRNKQTMLERLSRIKGVYVPSVHGRGAVIHRRIVNDLNAVEPGIALVPIIESTFNRLSLEIARGCTRGCRFCFAGMTQRPYRERSARTAYEYFNTWIDRTGYDEFSPSSLSISDFSSFNELFHCFYRMSMEKKASLSFPSLRTGSISREMAEGIREFRKTGFTIAPETYPALQNALNKNVNFDDMAADIENALSMGWTNLKLYFMLGLPGEDTQGFYEIKRFIKSVMRSVKMPRGNVTVSFSTFVPKPHTPLQWSAMNDLQTIREKQRLLKELFFPEKRIYLKLHNPFMSHLEGLIARGDETTGGLIEEAFRRGAYLDAWDEHLNAACWQDAIQATGFDAARYIRELSTDEKLPWEFIDAGLKKEFFAEEYRRYAKAETTPDCRTGTCSNCGACDFKETMHRFSEKLPDVPTGNVEQKEPVFHGYLLVYEKAGHMRYIGNMDIQRLWYRILRIAKVNLRYSGGFNPQPAIDGGWALPFGIESYCELLRFEAEPLRIDALAEVIRKLLPEGLVLREYGENSDRTALDHRIIAAEFYCAVPPQQASFDKPVEIVVKKDNKEKKFMTTDYMREYEAKEKGFYFTLAMKPGGLKPLDLAGYIAGRGLTPFDLIKTRVFMTNGETFGARTHH